MFGRFGAALKRAEDLPNISRRHGGDLTCVDRSRSGAFRHPISFLFSLPRSDRRASGLAPLIGLPAVNITPTSEAILPLSCVLCMQFALGLIDRLDMFLYVSRQMSGT